MITFRKADLSIFSLLIIFYFSTLFFYDHYISFHFDYLGFSNKFHKLRFVISIFIFIALIIYTLNISRTTFIRVTSLFFLALQMTPNFILWVFDYNFGLDIVLICVFFQLVIPLASLIRIHIYYTNTKFKYWTFFTLLIFLAIIPFVVVYKFDINFSNLLLNEIYATRLEARTKSNTFLNYAISPMGKILIPIMMVVSFKRRKYFLLVVLIILELYLFLTSAHKSILFSPLAIAFFYGGNYNRKIKVFLQCFLVSTFISLFASEYFDLPDLIQVNFVRRVMFIPAILNKYYFDLFRNEFVYLADSIFSFFLNYDNYTDPANLIGIEIFGNINMHANNGFISDGFMNFGYVGSILWIVFIFSLFVALNSLNIKPYFFGLIFILIYNLMGSPLFANMLTHGGIILLLSFYCINLGKFYNNGK